MEKHFGALIILIAMALVVLDIKRGEKGARRGKETETEKCIGEL
jgi:hypothetical protein